MGIRAMARDHSGFFIRSMHRMRRIALSMLAAWLMLWAPPALASQPEAGSADTAIFLAQQALEADEPERAWALLAEAGQLAGDDKAALDKVQALTLRLNAAYPANTQYGADNRLLAILPDRGDGTVSAVTMGRKLYHFDALTGVELGQQSLTLSRDAAERQLLDSVGGAQTAKALGLDTEDVVGFLIDSQTAKVVTMGPQHFAFGNAFDVSVFRRDNGAGVKLGSDVTWGVFADLVAMLSSRGTLSVQRVRPDGGRFVIQEIANADLVRCHAPADYEEARNQRPCKATFIEAASGDLLLFYESWKGDVSARHCLRIGDPVASEVAVDAIPVPINARQGIAVRRDADGLRGDLVALDCALTPQGEVGEYSPHGASQSILVEPDTWWNPAANILIGYDEENRMAVRVKSSRYNGQDELRIAHGAYPDGITSVALSPSGELLIGTGKARIDVYSDDFSYPARPFLDGEPWMAMHTGPCDSRDGGLFSGDICAINLIVPGKDFRVLDAVRGDGIVFRMAVPIPAMALAPEQEVIGAGLRGGAPILALRSISRDGKPVPVDNRKPDDACHIQIRSGAGDTVFDDIRAPCSELPYKIQFRPDGRAALAVGGDSRLFETGRWAEGKSVHNAVCATSEDRCFLDFQSIPLRDGSGFAVFYHGRLLDASPGKQSGIGVISALDGSLIHRMTDPLLVKSDEDGNSAWEPSHNIRTADFLDPDNHVLSLGFGGNGGPTIITIDGQRRNLPDAPIGKTFDLPDCLSMTPGNRLFYSKTSGATVVFDLAKGRIDTAQEDLRHRYVCDFSPDFERMRIDNSIVHARLDAPILHFAGDRISVVHDQNGQGGLLWNSHGYVQWREPPAGQALIDWLRITSPATLLSKDRDRIFPLSATTIDNGDCFAAPDWLFDPDRISDTALLIEWWKSFEITGNMADRMAACVAAKPKTGRQHYQRGLGLAAGSDLSLKSLNDSALKEFEAAAQRNYRSALLGQAMIWMFRKDGQSDPAKARALLEQAWKRGLPSAATLQGILYEADWFAGDEPARAQAQTWFLRSACAGEPLAFSRLASMVEQDMRTSAVSARLLIDVPNDLGCGFPLAANASPSLRLLAFLSAAMMLAPAEQSINPDTGWRKSNLARAMPPAEAAALQRALDNWADKRRGARR